MTAQTLKKKQEEMHERIWQNAQDKGLIKQKPKLEPLYDGVTDIEGYLSSNLKIMWILKEGYDGFTAKGQPKGGDWSFTNSEFWDEACSSMHKVMMQITYSAQNGNIPFKKLDNIDDNPEMRDAIKKSVYLNISKMPAYSSSGDLSEEYLIWKDIILEQIKLYAPDVIIFGYTFGYMRYDLGITDNDKPIHTQSGKWCSDIYQKDNMILVDAYHPARKGGEDGSHDYVTSIINALKKIDKK
ncbi:MAG: hypothetical protein IKQ61_04630 [Spirochaetales bacterium]|nr:hypothetical protein [Spirochaetales bacterium]